jgi:glycosyltransferase involved in cell wall biosynthesis
MRIALYHNLTSGGSKREAYELSRQLVRQGHTVHAFLPSTANEEYLPLASVVQQQTIFKLDEIKTDKYRIPGLRKYFDLLSNIVNARKLDKTAREIASLVNQGQYDFAFTHNDRIVQSPYLLRYISLPSFYYCAEINRGVYEPLLARSDESNIHQSVIDRLQNWWYSPIPALHRSFIRREDYRNILQADHLLTNSYFTKESIRRIYNLQSDVVYLGVDHEFFKPLPSEKQNIVISVGAINPLKGFDFIIQAMEWIPANVRPRLVIVGNSASSAEVKYLNEIAGK